MQKEWVSQPTPRPFQVPRPIGALSQLTRRTAPEEDGISNRRFSATITPPLTNGQERRIETTPIEFAPPPRRSLAFDRRGARAKARQPPPCSFYLAVSHHKTYNTKQQNNVPTGNTPFGATISSPG